MSPVDRLKDRVKHAEGFSSVVTGREIYVPLSDLKAVLDRLSDVTAHRDDLLGTLGYLLDAHWPLVEDQDTEDPACAKARAALERTESA